MKLSPQYIAGFIDGEGYFGIVKKSSPACTLGYYYVPVLKITQVSRNDEVLRAIVKFIGCGNLTLDKRNALASGNGVNKTSLEFRGMKRVTPIAELLYKYLIVKKKQAKVLMDFSKIPMVRDGYSQNKATDRKRAALYEEIRFLNRHGLAETKRREAERLSNSPNRVNK